MRIYEHEEYLLGNPTLHLQLSAALAALAQVACNSKHPPSAATMAENLDISVRYLRKLLRTLEAGGLLLPDGRDDTWRLAREPHAISLADLYLCLVQAERAKQGAGMAGKAGSGTGSADLLIMQATMSLNQLVLQHLQQFDLGRLRAAESALAYTAALRERLRQKAESADYKAAA